MARIPEEEVERIKGEIALVRVVEAAGVELSPHGKDLIGRCPFHDDKTPSLVVSPDKNLWHCLGACQTGGSVIDWTVKAESVSIRHALELLRERHFPTLVAEPKRGRPAQDGRVYPKHSSVRKLPLVVDRNADDEALLRQVVEYYQEQLKQSPEALGYLEKRGLRSSEMLERFRLGYANRTLGYRLPAKQVQAGAELRGRLQRLGVYGAKGHELLSGSLVIPVFDSEGRVTEMYGRKINDHLRKGTPKHLYLPGPHRGVWNEEALSSSKELILCESLIDALTFWCAGFRHVTASYGVEGFTDDHRAAFRKHGTERILIAYDRDAAGDKAAEKLSRELATMGIEVRRVLFPKGMDANEYVLKVGPAEKSLRVALQNAEWMGGSSAGGRGRGELTSVDARGNVLEEAIKGENEPAGDDVTKSPSAITAVSAASTEPPADVPIEHVTPEPATEVDEEETFPHLAAQGAGPGATESEPSPVARKVSSSSAEQASRSVAAAERVSLPAKDEQLSQNGDELVLVLGDRRWRLRGLLKNTNPSALRINAHVSRAEAFHIDTLELYSARQRTAYIKQASEELNVEERVIKRDLGVVLLKLEELQEKAQLLENEKRQLARNPEYGLEQLTRLVEARGIDRTLAEQVADAVVELDAGRASGRQQPGAVVERVRRAGGSRAGED